MGFWFPFWSPQFTPSISKARLKEQRLSLSYPPGGHLADPQLDLGRSHQGELTKTAESELQAFALLIDENISRSPG